MRQRKSTWTSIGDYPAFVLQTDAMVDFHHMGTDQRNVDREGCGIYPAAHGFVGCWLGVVPVIGMILSSAVGAESRSHRDGLVRRI